MHLHERIDAHVLAARPRASLMRLRFVDRIGVHKMRA